MEYREIVRAWQYRKGEEVPEWVNGIIGSIREGMAMDLLFVYIDRNRVELEYGDWVVRRQDGRQSVAKPDEFEEWYKPDDAGCVKTDIKELTDKISDLWEALARIRHPEDS